MAWKFFTSTGSEKVSSKETTPVGLIAPYAGSSPPSGWLFCNGSAVSRTTYATLFAEIAGTYGEGDGSTTFHLPDMRGRIAVANYQGYGDRTTTSEDITGTGIITGGNTLAEQPLGAWSGAEGVALSSTQSGIAAHGSGHAITSSSHNHGVTIQDGGSHNHGVGYNIVRFATGDSYPQGPNESGALANTVSTVSISPSITNATSGASISNNTAETGDSHSNMMPGLVVNFIIKT